MQYNFRAVDDDQWQWLCRSESALTRALFDNTDDAVIVKRLDGQVLLWNPGAESLFGYSAQEMVGHPITALFPPDRLNEEAELMARLSTGMRVRQVETQRRRKDGTLVDVSVTLSPIRDGEGRITAVAHIARDITPLKQLIKEHQRAQREAEFRARHDALTGLPNRSAFDERLRDAYAASQSTGRPHALLYISLDHCKQVNDNLGHAAGDRLLQEAAAVLRGSVRAQHTVARLGGDEFAVLMQDATPLQARRLAQQLSRQMQDFRFMHDGLSFTVGSSIGVVQLEAPWQSLEEAEKAAGTASYVAKRTGRNRVHEWACAGSRRA